MSTQALWAWAAPIGSYVGAFALFSTIFSLLSWGHSPGGLGFQYAGPSLFVHIALHVALGAEAAVAARRWNLIVTAGLIAIFLDTDHIGHYIGLPMVGRGSHSLVFFGLAAGGMGLLAQRGWFGGIRPALAVGVAMAAGLSHLAVDALSSDGYGNFPLWAPVTYADVPIQAEWGILLEILAIGVVWCANVIDRGFFRR